MPDGYFFAWKEGFLVGTPSRTIGEGVEVGDGLESYDKAQVYYDRCVSTQGSAASVSNPIIQRFDIVRA